MRCPKCQYISFDDAGRCRNCGYEFSLAVDVKSLDLPIQTGDEPLGPMSDLSLGDLDAARRAAAVGSSPPKPPGGFDLPLFKDRVPDDDRPLVSPPAIPRAPLAVRKSTPAVTRSAPRSRADEPELDLGPPESGGVTDRKPAATSVAAEAGTNVPAASLGRRLTAFLIDAALLGSVNLVILYFTLRLCGLEWFEMVNIPPVPFLSFLLLQNGGYFVAFVAVGGQTLGKMALNIKVVPADAAEAWSDRVPLGLAVVRAAAWFLTVLPAGIGLLPALLSADRRAVHDRLAGTRVVNA